MYNIGIDLGGTNIAVGLVTDDGTIMKKISTPTLAHRPPEDIVRDMANLIYRLAEESSLNVEDIDFCGIATPESLTASTGQWSIRATCLFAISR